MARKHVARPALDRLFIGDIDGGEAVGLAEALRELLDMSRLPAAAEHGVAGFDKALGEGAAEAAACAGNDDRAPAHG
jgi:hypothetical protein